MTTHQQSNTQWTGKKVRQTFIDYFCNKQGHVNVPSSPVIPYDDPTLLFTNSGMCQFKPIFLGQIDPKSDRAKWKRAANSQKCIRAGGKHNDLDDVGKDTYHHTFFEMLGNWSFGDYFQTEAIDWAWEILTKVYGIDPNRIYATYFKGDDVDKLPADNAAKQIWKKYLPDERILPFGRKENFWEMGDTGPCGPCTEIHFDRIGGRDASALVNADSPEVIEIWNLVFMQFNREDSGKLTELPNKHVDTGMGFERLTSVLQHEYSNYDTDIFKPIFSKIQEVTKAPVYGGLLGKDDVKGIDTAYRIIADHIRTLTFAITDGARPGHYGRSFVLRRILRRALRAGKEFLHASDGFFYQLVDVVVENFGDAFPELIENAQRVKSVICEEEKSFSKTLSRGINKFKSLTRKMKNGDTLSDIDTFLLYCSYGFPLDLIAIMCEENGFKVETVGFTNLLNESRKFSQTAYGDKDSAYSFSLSAGATAKLKEKNVPITIDVHKYELEDVNAKVLAIWEGTTEDGSFKESCSVGSKSSIILDITNFYAQSGGQVADTGFLMNDEAKFAVQDTQAFAGYITHSGVVVAGSIKVGDSVICTVNNEKRRPIMANHTSTHMLNLALRQIVDPKTDQRGSVVSEDRFRFDFACSQPVNREQLEKLDNAVNQLIKSNIPVYIKELPTDEAKKIRGLRAIFTEAYPNPVRVVSVGIDLNEVMNDTGSEKWEQYSIEFCGGSHLKHTGEAQLFTIVSEGPLQAGVRRIEAITGELAIQALENTKSLQNQLDELMKLQANDPKLSTSYTEFKKLLDSSRIPAFSKIDMREKLGEIEQKLKTAYKGDLGKIKQGSSQLIDKIVSELKVSKAEFVVEILDVGANNRILNDTALEIVTTVKKDLNLNVAVMLLSADNVTSKTILVANNPKEIIDKGLKANEWVGEIAKFLGGKGGGKPVGDVAQGNAPGTDKVQDALIKAKEYANQKLNK